MLSLRRFAGVRTLPVLALLALLVLLFAGNPLFAQGSEVVEIFTQHFYDNLSITGQRLADGNLVAYVTLAPKAASGARSRVVAKYVLNKATLTGDFTVLDEGGTPESLDFFDYRNQPGFDHLEAEVAAHTVRSVTLAALWLWEDYEAQRSSAVVSEQGVLVCPGCSFDNNGCSPAWLIPQSCGGANIAGACLTHDACYQCGATCSGATRAQCDAQFRADITAITGSPFCGRVYWLGVRALGWLFFQDPTLRPYMGGDVYSLGISINPCPANMQHLCTTIVM